MMQTTASILATKDPPAFVLVLNCKQASGHYGWHYWPNSGYDHIWLMTSASILDPFVSIQLPALHGSSCLCWVTGLIVYPNRHWVYIAGWHDWWVSWCVWLFTIYKQKQKNWINNCGYNVAHIYFYRGRQISGGHPYSKGGFQIPIRSPFTHSQPLGQG